MIGVVCIIAVGSDQIYYVWGTHYIMFNDSAMVVGWIHFRETFLKWLDGWQYNASDRNNQLSVCNHDTFQQEEDKSYAIQICSEYLSQIIDFKR